MTHPSPISRTAAITASYSGLGFELSRLLLGEGFRLVCIDRSSAKSETARRALLAQFPEADIMSVTADMASPASITQAADRILADVHSIDVLFHVAGAATAEKQMSPTGTEIHFQVNTLAPVALTEALKPALSNEGGAVVVAVGSSAMKMARTLKVAGLTNPPSFKKMSGPYAQSKLAITTAFVAMSASYKKQDILLRVVDPGPARTPMSASDAMPWIVRRIRRFFPLPEVGARKIFSAGVSEKFADETGIYIERDAISKLPAAATDSDIQSVLMTLISECTQAETALAS